MPMYMYVKYNQWQTVPSRQNNSLYLSINSTVTKVNCIITFMFLFTKQSTSIYQNKTL